MMFEKKNPWVALGESVFRVQKGIFFVALFGLAAGLALGQIDGWWIAAQVAGVLVNLALALVCLALAERYPESNFAALLSLGSLAITQLTIVGLAVLPFLKLE